MNKFPSHDIEDKSLSCSIGIMAYNEAANIEHLLKALSGQKLNSVSIKEIIVVASGCIDNTEEIVRRYISEDPRVRLIVQKERKGKASAVNLFLREATEKILVMESADTIPQEDTIEKLVLSFLNPDVGMTGGHPVPVNKNNDFTGFCVHLLWELHHQLCIYYPKMGELIAFRNIFYKIPESTSVDEASIEPLVKGQGFLIQYIPEAIVLNKGAENISDFIRSRRRIFAGHLAIKRKFGYEVSTMNSLRIFKILLKSYNRFGFKKIFWIPGVGILELYSRLLGMIDYYVYKREFAVWEISTTTKELIK
ncbi:MAG TPA: glycosyltransferase [Candidatus Eremiobacteraeota bacterium]|nr:MAG: Poly-beta-1,6-N-acetyl-D-glucosamine synthase [bacterium ADurb.Bin363]HPZ09211.1 glycosyltransferase [Candidatus Eremiobacteraeota bacterium]